MSEIVSGVATLFLDKLATKACQEIVLACGLKDGLKRLQNSMRITLAYLMDAENRPSEEHSITEWMQQLKDAIYDANDLLDEIDYQTKRSEVVKMYGSTTRKVHRYFSRSHPLAFRLKMAHKIKNIKERIDEIITNGKNLGLTELRANSTTVNQKLSWRETSSFVPPRVSGTSRYKEEEKIISLLLSTPTPSQSQVSNIDVIPIVGIGGVGKTTIAQLVYNDDRVKQHFDTRMWVCVSDEFDVRGVILNIIKEADKTERSVDHNSSLNELQSLLRKKLHKKKFLLVLDDVWNENAKKWDDLRNFLLGTGGELKTKGSKIIVTTRSHNVASIMGTVPKIELEPLPSEECWKLFVKCAFSREEEEAKQYPMLQEIGKEIVEKCKGLPLAVVTLGCLLRSKLHDENEWKEIRDSKLWDIDSKDDGILPVLRLSYNHLPSHLKRCFSYCSIFPKDFAYVNTELIPFWMAHGLLQSTNEKEEPEYLGELYIKQLVSTSLFQAEWEDNCESLIGFNYFKMHDLVHDLAMSTMQSERDVCHLSIPNIDDGVHSAFPSMSNKIRTIGQWQEGGDTETVTKLSVELLSNEFKYLRVLDLRYLNCSFLPDCFDKMRHLRLLRLRSCNLLEKLPDSICKLHLLQSLFLRGCTGLQELPKNMRNLISLLHLSITVQETCLSSINIGCFKFLQTLMVVGCINLVSLPHDIAHLIALKKLYILGCENLVSFEDEGEQEGKQHEVVKDLSLQVFAIERSPRLTALPNWLRRASKTLQCMFIGNTGLRVLPEWLPNLATLDTLYITRCPRLLSLPNHMDNLRGLQRLYILDCPDLIARCQKDTGPDWPKIAHIQHIELYDES